MTTNEREVDATPDKATNTIETYRNIDEELEKQKQIWNKQVEILNRDWERKYQQLEALNNYHRQTIKDQNEMVLKEAGTYQSTIDKLQQEKEEATELFTKEVTKNVKNEEEIKEFKSRFEALEWENTSLRNKNSTLREEIFNLKEEIEKVKQEFQEYRQKNINTPEIQPQRKRKLTEDPKYFKIKSKIRKLIQKKKK
jgi:DNA repair exonuclease SbcCD ATPase subunit